MAQQSGGRNRAVKIAMLGGFTTHQLVTLLDLYLCAERIAPEIYEADYGIFRQELIDPESELYRFRPEFIILATSWRDLGHHPHLGDDRATVQRKVEEELGDWMRLWKTAHDRLGCQLIRQFRYAALASARQSRISPSRWLRPLHHARKLGPADERRRM